MVVQAFHINDNAFGVKLIAQVINEIIEIKVSHGTDTDEMTETQIFPIGPAQNRAADCSGLRNDCDIALLRRIRHQADIKIGQRTKNANAIGS